MNSFSCSSRRRRGRLAAAHQSSHNSRGIFGVVACGRLPRLFILNARANRRKRTTNWRNHTWHRRINKVTRRMKTHRTDSRRFFGLRYWSRRAGDESHKINTRADVLVQFAVHNFTTSHKKSPYRSAVFFRGCLRNKNPARYIFN